MQPRSMNLMIFFIVHHHFCVYKLGRKLLLAVVLLSGIIWAGPSHAQTGRGNWYRGDLHAHSTYSDGDSPVADVIARAETLGLDFFALTDHDVSMDGNPIHFGYTFG